MTSKARNKKTKQMRYTIIFTLIAGLVLVGCNDSDDNLYDEMLPGFWKQESISVDGETQQLSDCEQSVRLLIERNGIYRLFSTCDDKVRAGTWLLTENNTLDLTMDRRRGNNFEPYPIRFTILDNNDTQLEIRIKTFVDERKRTVMFTPLPPDNLEGMTPEEILELDFYNKQLKTYIYRFTKN